jgi:hypothetical protein
MASPYIYQSLGGTTGSRIATSTPTFCSGRYWFVGPGGSDAASPRGLDRKRPLATLAQAYTNAAAGDTIVFLKDHVESLNNPQTLAKAGLTLCSESSGSSRARFTPVLLTGDMFDVTAAGVTIDNIYFPKSVATPSSRVRIAAAGATMENCYFDSSGDDVVPAVRVVTSGNNFTAKGTYWVSTATAVTAQPTVALQVENAVSDLKLEDCRFDGGAFGWSSYAFNGQAAITRLTTLGLELLNSSRFLTATGSVFKINLKSASMATFLELTA